MVLFNRIFEFLESLSIPQFAVNLKGAVMVPMLWLSERPRNVDVNLRAVAPAHIQVR